MHSIRIPGEEEAGGKYDLEHQPLLSSSSTSSIHIDTSKQPLTHVLNKSFWERFFFFLRFCCFRYDLDAQELKAFYALRKEANVHFQETMTEYNHVFRRLFKILHNTDLPEDSIISEGWKKFGFQNKDPRKDIRGGGVLALNQLLVFCEKHRKLALQMSEDEEKFIFAITSVNVTFYLKKYFHLADFLDFKNDRRDICSRRALKNFARVLIRLPELLDELHCILLTRVFEEWLRILRTNSKITLLEFDRGFNIVKKHFKKVFDGGTFRDFYTLKAKLERTD
jgi:hypothetical protein